MPNQHQHLTKLVVAFKGLVLGIIDHAPIGISPLVTFDEDTIASAQELLGHGVCWIVGKLLQQAFEHDGVHLVQVTGIEGEVFVVG